MKFTINVECSPDEARKFLGWPDLQEMQSQMVKAMQDRMVEQLGQMDAEKLIQNWLPMGLQAAENWQKMFFSHMANAGETFSFSTGSSENDKKS